MLSICRNVKAALDEDAAPVDFPFPANFLPDALAFVERCPFELPKECTIFETFFFSSVDFATESPAGQRVATYLRDTLVRPGYVAQGHAQVISWYFTLLLFSPLKSEDFVGAP